MSQLSNRIAGSIGRTRASGASSVPLLKTLRVSHPYALNPSSILGTLVNSTVPEYQRREVINNVFLSNSQATQYITSPIAKSWLHGTLEPAFNLLTHNNSAIDSARGMDKLVDDNVNSPLLEKQIAAYVTSGRHSRAITLTIHALKRNSSLSPEAIALCLRSFAAAVAHLSDPTVVPITSNLWRMITSPYPQIDANPCAGSPPEFDASRSTAPIPADDPEVVISFLRLLRSFRMSHLPHIAGSANVSARDSSDPSDTRDSTTASSISSERTSKGGGEAEFSARLSEIPTIRLVPESSSYLAPIKESPLSRVVLARNLVTALSTNALQSKPILAEYLSTTLHLYQSILRLGEYSIRNSPKAQKEANEYISALQSVSTSEALSLLAGEIRWALDSIRTFGAPVPVPLFSSWVQSGLLLTPSGSITTERKLFSVDDRSSMVLAKLESLTLEELLARIIETGVFCKMKPSDKLHNAIDQICASRKPQKGRKSTTQTTKVRELLEVALPIPRQRRTKQRRL